MTVEETFRCGQDTVSLTHTYHGVAVTCPCSSEVTTFLHKAPSRLLPHQYTKIEFLPLHFGNLSPAGCCKVERRILVCHKITSSGSSGPPHPSDSGASTCQMSKRASKDVTGTVFSCSSRAKDDTPSSSGIHLQVVATQTSFAAINKYCIVTL